MCLLWFLYNFHGSACFIRLFWFLCNLYKSVLLMCLLWFLYDIHDGTEFTRYAFSIYTSYSASNTIVSFPLQSTICVNYCRPTPLLIKRWIASLLFSSSSGTESSCLTRQTTSSGFTPINSVLRLFGTESPSLFVRHKKIGNKGKTVAKEAARDENYNLPM